MKTYVIGIDIGGTNTRIALINERLEIERKESFATQQFNQSKSFLSHLYDTVEKINFDKKANTIGIVLPIPWKSNQKVMVDVANISYLEGLHVSEVEMLFDGYSLHFENDVNVVALLESKVGSAKGYNNSLYITISTGIGSGIIINNKIYSGANGYAGEIGTTPIHHPTKGVMWLEHLCSGDALHKESIRLFGEQGTAGMLFEEYHKHQPDAIKVIDDWKEWLSTGLASLSLIVDPGIIVLGGAVTINQPWVLPLLMEATRKKVFPHMANKIKMEISTFGLDVGLIGAGHYALVMLNAK